jgi:hypothetical protein
MSNPTSCIVSAARKDNRKPPRHKRGANRRAICEARSWSHLPWARCECVFRNWLMKYRCPLLLRTTATHEVQRTHARRVKIDYFPKTTLQVWALPCKCTSALAESNAKSCGLSYTNVHLRGMRGPRSKSNVEPLC